MIDIDFHFREEIEVIDATFLYGMVNRAMWCARQSFDVEIIPKKRGVTFRFSNDSDAVHYKLRWFGVDAEKIPQPGFFVRS